MPFAVSGIALSGPDGRASIGARLRGSCSSMQSIRSRQAGEFPTIKTPEWVVEPRLRDLPERRTRRSRVRSRFDCRSRRHRGRRRSSSLRASRYRLTARQRLCVDRAATARALVRIRGADRGSQRRAVRARRGLRPRSALVGCDYASFDTGAGDTVGADHMVRPDRSSAADATCAAGARDRSGADAHHRARTTRRQLGPRRDDGDGSVACAASACDPDPPLHRAAAARQSPQTRRTFSASGPTSFASATNDLVDRASAFWPAAGCQGRAASSAGHALHGIPFSRGGNCAASHRRDGAARDRRIPGQASHRPGRRQRSANAHLGALYAQVMQADGATRRNVLIARAPAIPHLDVVNGKPIPSANTRRRGRRPVRRDRASNRSSPTSRYRPTSPLSVTRSRVTAERSSGRSRPSRSAMRRCISRSISPTRSRIPSSPVRRFIAAPPQASDPLGRDLGTSDEPPYPALFSAHAGEGRLLKARPVGAGSHQVALEAIRQADGKGLRPEIRRIEVGAWLRRANERGRRIVAVSHRLGTSCGSVTLSSPTAWR